MVHKKDLDLRVETLVLMFKKFNSFSNNNFAGDFLTLKVMGDNKAHLMKQIQKG